MSKKRLLRKWQALSWRDRRLLLKMASLLGATRVLLWLLPFRTVRRLFEWLSTRPTGSLLPGADYRRRILWAARATGRRLLGQKPCLTQALVVQALLKRAGYAAELRIGVAKGDEGELLAHAWVEAEGKTILGGYRSPLQYTMLRPINEKDHS